MHVKAQAPRLSVYSSSSLNEAVRVAAEEQMLSESAWVRLAVLSRLREQGIPVEAVKEIS